MNTKTILLTGGAGFIGFHTAKTLLMRGDRVIIVDNLNDYYDPSIKESRLKELEKISTNLLVKRIDICEYQDLEEIFKSEKINTVVNLAAQAGVRYSISHPFTYEKTNIRGFLNLLELCRHHDVKDFIFASSSSVYGANTKMPFSEDDKVDTPISLYAASKKSNEEMAFTYHHLYGLNCTGLRFFTVYGPWGRPDMALFLFTDAIVKNKPINVFNNGEMARDFTYIDDIVAGVIASIDKSFAYEIFNLARGESVRLMDYIKEIENNLGKVAVKNMLPMQAGDVPKSDADISKARRLLAYNPQTSVKEGIKNFVDWYRGYYGEA
jgi:UDP-glucuronate 4-epimerase